MKSLDEEIQHFKAIPWCSRHLQDPNLVLGRLGSRTPKARSSEDAFFGELLHTSDAIPALVTAYARPPGPPGSALDEVRCFVTLGEKVDGWPGVCHGGVVGAILDEVPTLLLKVNAPGRAFMTAYLNTTFLGPVRTPGTIMVVSRLKRVQGRKVYVESVVEGEKGERLAKADALFVDTRAML